MSGKDPRYSGDKGRGQGRGRGRSQGRGRGGDQNASQFQPQTQQRWRSMEVGSGSGSARYQTSWNTTERNMKPDYRTQFDGKSPNTVGESTVNLVANHFKMKTYFSDKSFYKHEVKIEAYNMRREKYIPLKDKTKKRGLIREGFNIATNDMYAYDGSCSIFTAKRENFPDEDWQVQEGNPICTYQFTGLNANQELKLIELAKYCLKNSNADSNPDYNRDLDELEKVRPILHGLDTIISENYAKDNKKWMQFRKYFYDKETKKDLKGEIGFRILDGFKQRIKATSNGISLCLDYSAAKVYKTVTVMDFVKDMVRRSGHPGWKEIEKKLRGLKVRDNYSTVRRKYTISGLSDESLKYLSFKTNNNEEITVYNYFTDTLHLELDNLDCPCLNLGSTQHPIYIPLNYCEFDEDQICLVKDGLEIKPVDVAWRMSKINEFREQFQSDDAFVKHLGIEVDVCMTEVKGRVIASPKFKFGKVEKLNTWCLMDFRRDRRSQLYGESQFMKCWKDASNKLGMDMKEPITHKNYANNIEQELKQIVDKYPDLQIIICVVSGKDSAYYDQLKWISETKIGVMTQCLDYNTYLENVEKDDKKRSGFVQNSGKNVNPNAVESYFKNLCRKINQKVGGRNMELNEPLRDFGDKPYVMLIGADVNHPPPNDNTSPSIAAVVGTVNNWPAANHYIARITHQFGRKDQIENFGAMCKDLINAFRAMNGRIPDRILIFRDGVGESQIKSFILDGELKNFRDTFSGDKHGPKITVVMAQKRHHTRLFAYDQKGYVTNVGAGTVVDKDIVDPSPRNFYLCSHNAMKGTSKPTHYTVLHDDNKIELKKLEELIFKLCFTYANCTKSISLVPPIYYADKAAYRGRKYYHAWRNKNPDAVIDDSTLKLHDNIKNKMFFI